jgi:EmrB/QacA subfamily drug resistance transporter
MTRERLVPLIVAVALFMENMDSTVIATSLPAIAADIGASPLELKLAITSYLLALAIFIPASGWMADRFGARTVFRAAIGVFTLGSILCGFSGDLSQLTGARIVQGIGGAMMVPIGRLVLLRSVTKSEMVQAMSYLTVPALLGPVLGPPVGGFIVTYASWRWIFFLNVPIGVVGFILVAIFIENHKEPGTPPLDVAGFLLSALALGGLMLGFETVGRQGLPLPAALTILAGGIGALALYLRHAAVHPHPILDPLLFRIPTFAVSTGAGFLFRVGVGALPFLLPLLLQLGFGMTAFSSGLITFTSAAGALLMKFTARPILRILGFRTVLAGNAVLSAAFLFSYGAFRPTTPLLLILALLALGGFFRSLQFTGLSTLGFADVPPQRMSAASSMTSTFQQLSASVGVATGAMLLHLVLVWRGGDLPEAGDFWPAFALIGSLSLISAIFFARLPANAGAEVSGHKLSGARLSPPSPAS